MPMSTHILQDSSSAHKDRNKLRPEDQSVHNWYRFILSFPPHLVRRYVDKFGIDGSKTVLDPFCGTGTTLVECKKLGIPSIGVESNPMAHFASSVKIDWSVGQLALLDYADEVAASTRKALDRDSIDDWNGLPLFQAYEESRTPMRGLPPEQSKLLLKNSISPTPLHKTLVLLDAIDRHGDHQLRRYGRLALAKALVHRIGNLKFGPEVGVGQVRVDAPVLDAWLGYMRAIAHDISMVDSPARTPVRVLKADSREIDQVLELQSVDAVITSPPYPNEKDYTRTTRLESVVLGLICDRHDLRALKQGLVRSNTRSVYKGDTDDREVSKHTEIQNIAESIERRRVELGKTSGFERLYPRVTQLYFGGMVRHLASMRSALKPGSKLAYVVGDQASYLRIMIRTGAILADLARSLGYEVSGIELFRTRSSTATGEQLREEVVLLEWPGN